MEGEDQSGWDAIWAQWRALIRARRDGQVSETEYRRATGDLRRRLDAISAPETPSVATEATDAPPLADDVLLARTSPDPAWLVHPAAARRVAPDDGEPSLLGPGGVLAIVLIVAVLAAAVGFALVSVAA